MRTCYLMALIVFISFSSCKKGCTDYFASNYDSEAKKDDGSCFYGGCTDVEALNFSPSAEQDDGSCEYPSDVYFYNHIKPAQGYVIEVYWEDQYVGGFVNNSSVGIAYCEQTSEAVDVLDVDPGMYSYEVITKRGGTNDTGEIIESGSLQLGASECNYIVID